MLTTMMALNAFTLSCDAGNMAYIDTMPDLMSETISMGTLGKQAEYDRRRRRKCVLLASF